MIGGAGEADSRQRENPRVMGYRWQPAGSGIIFILLLIGVGGCGDLQDSLPLGMITIDSSPESGAEVMIQGASYGETPVAVEGVSPGELLVVLTKEKYSRTLEVINITSGGENRFLIELAPLFGFVTFESKPPGAEVILEGGKRLGETPLFEAKAPVGKHTYEMRLEDYRTLRSELTVEADYRYTVAQELTPKLAKLKVFSRPTNAMIWLNDEPQVNRTPTRFNLMPGAYTVGLYVKGFVRTETTVSLGPNEERSVEISLKEGDVPPGMVLVPGGKFIMGGAVPDERPLREVDVDSFYIDKYEVTNEEFQRVFPEHSFAKGNERCAAAGVSYNRASEYALRVHKRLPTEAEWEKAARGPDGREYPWGEEFGRDCCNSFEVGEDRVMAVGKFRRGASPYGCMDMAGSVHEWTSDWYQAYPGNKDVKKDYGQIFRVLRGGSYKSDRFGVRCARRHYDRMAAVRADYGFRCVKHVE